MPEVRGGVPGGGAGAGGPAQRADRHRRRRRPRRLRGRVGAGRARRPRSRWWRCAPCGRTPAHQTDLLAELVCSNSFKSVETANAHGLLKAELRLLGSLLLGVRGRGARAGRRGAGRGPRGLRAPRHRAGRGAPEHPRGAGGGRRRCPSPGIVATGPLTSDRLADAIQARLGRASPGLLRRHRAHRRRRLARPRAALPRRPATARGAATTTSTPRSTRRSTRRSWRRWPPPTSTRATTSTRCRTSRAACRSRRWRGGAPRRCASAR